MQLRSSVVGMIGTADRKSVAGYLCLRQPPDCPASLIRRRMPVDAFSSHRMQAIQGTGVRKKNEPTNVFLIDCNTSLCASDDRGSI